MNEMDPRVKRTRKLLLDAFVALLGTQRFNDISVQDIAERATVNRATFYAHFEDKYALLDEVIAERFRAMVTSQVSPSAPFTFESLRALIATVLTSQAQFHDGCQHHAPGRDMSPLLEAKVQQELRGYLREWLGRSAVRDPQPEMAREVIASAMSWAIFGAAVEWSRGDRRLSAEQRARQVARILMDGVAGLVRQAPVAIAQA